MLAAFVLASNLIAGVGINILFDGHASQARSRLTHQPVAERTTTRTEGAAKAPQPEPDDAGHKDCVPAPPAYHEISQQARQQDRERHLLVHKGDRRQTAQAITESVRQRQGYAITSAAPPVHTSSRLCVSTAGVGPTLISTRWNLTANSPTYGRIP